MNEEIMKRYRHPVHRGDVEEFSRSCRQRQAGEVWISEGDNPFCGDSLRIAYCLRDGRIEEVCYDGYGCSLCIASAECVLDLIKGREQEDAFRVTTEMILAALGDVKVGKSRMKCVELALTVLREGRQES